ncbi:MAG TPA: tripartite tricarboxylate transporter substrate-binding protein [Candidatus Binatia bacterium]|nr:tripartite tricarboxylate transporter substrate-binding protein [Candidatus Binatia bacterium]
MLMKIFAGVAVVAGLTVALNSSALAASDEFYKGKVIRIVVGFSAGGGFDTYARSVARHMGKYVPGNPTIVVENMTGAGSLIAANHVYKVAKPDGLTLGAFNGNQILGQLVGAPGINFDARKMEWVGAPGYNHDLCVVNRQSGVSSAEQWLSSKTPLKLGGSAPGAPTDDGPKILKEAVGLPIRLVSGYKGTADIRVAVESGEVDGLCGFSWASVRATWRKAIESGQVAVLLQTAPKAHGDLPKVPLSISFAKTAEARQLIEAGVHQPSSLTYSYSLPPATPKDRVQTLRKALSETLKDEALLNEAAKANLEIAPASGEQIEQSIRDLFKTEPKVVAKLKEVLK